MWKRTNNEMEKMPGLHSPLRRSANLVLAEHSESSNSPPRNPNEMAYRCCGMAFGRNGVCLCVCGFVCKKKTFFFHSSNVLPFHTSEGPPVIRFANCGTLRKGDNGQAVSAKPGTIRVCCLFETVFFFTGSSENSPLSLFQILNRAQVPLTLQPIQDSYLVGWRLRSESSVGDGPYKLEW